MYGILQANSIPNPTHLAPGLTQPDILYAATTEAVGRLLVWCADKMQRYIGQGSAPHSWAHWQYVGCRPVARLLKGTINPAFAPTKNDTSRRAARAPAPLRPRSRAP